MKLRILFFASVLTLSLQTITWVHAQGTFQNLDFESATLVAIPGDSYGRVQFVTAFPGWVAYCGGVQQTAALYNNAYLDSSGVAIIDNNWPHYLGPTAGLIEGNFTALLQAGVGLGTSIPADTTLFQTGLVPFDAESLQFKAYAAPFGSVRVLLGGQALTLFALETGANYTLFGADIHDWQGQTTQLDFTVIAQNPHIVDINIFLDSIEFSNQPIPEPSTFCLFGLGALLLGCRFLRKQR